MTGTLFGLPLSQQTDVNGKPLSGCLLTIYQAGTLIVADAFQDTALSPALKLSSPMVADSSGRLPQFWLADGSYRARLTTAGGVLVFDIDGILAIGPSSGTSGGGGATVATNGFQTGMMMWQPISGTQTGFVRCNAKTLGSASSGATERANSDTQPLYLFLWTNFPDSICPVTSGRGGTATGDFTANKSIAILDMRGYGGLGLDDMGNTAAGRIVGGSPTTPGTSGGSEKSSITIAQANLPNVSFALNLTDPGHSHTQTTDNIASVGIGVSSTGGSGRFYASQNPGPTDVATTGITGTAASGGSGTAIAATTISPYRMGTWYIKL